MTAGENREKHSIVLVFYGYMLHLMVISFLLHQSLILLHKPVLQVMVGELLQQLLLITLILLPSITLFRYLQLDLMYTQLEQLLFMYTMVLILILLLEDQKIQN